MARRVKAILTILVFPLVLIGFSAGFIFAVLAAAFISGMNKADNFCDECREQCKDDDA